jgi:hypothetical protein
MILGTHFETDCTKTIRHNADSLSALTPVRAFPVTNVERLYGSETTLRKVTIKMAPYWSELELDA